MTWQVTFTGFRLFCIWGFAVLANHPALQSEGERERGRERKRERDP